MTIQVKICGLTNVDDAVAALGCGADYLGFVLHPPSPRGITAARLRQILDRLPAGTRAVAVFVNLARADLEAIAADCGLHAAQLHGDEAPRLFAEVRLPLWRALRFEADAWQPRPEDWPAERYVVDAAVPGRYGGTGTLADWTAAAALARRQPVMLAGGLTPENVAQAVAAVRPLGVDVASGVEAGPGRKDHAKVARFISEARRAAAEAN